jgi:hypothetical protein
VEVCGSWKSKEGISNTPKSTFTLGLGIILSYIELEHNLS